MTRDETNKESAEMDFRWSFPLHQKQEQVHRLCYPEQKKKKKINNPFVQNGKQRTREVNPHETRTEKETVGRVGEDDESVAKGNVMRLM